MARIRSIHPGIYTDEAWASVSIGARWLGMGLCTEADDNGVFEWKPLQLKMRIFPADAVDVAALLDELSGAGILLRFSAEGKTLGAVRNFCKFQRPRKPKAWFPLTDVARVFVALGAEPAVEDEPEPAPVPQKSELPPVEATPVPPKSEKSPQMEDGGGRRKKVRDADASLVPGRGPQIWDDVFVSAWEAYPRLGRDRSMSRAKVWPLWREAAQQAGGPEKLLAAVRRYVRDDKTHKGDCGPPAFDRWLKAGRWEHFLDGEISPRIVVVFPDPEIRAAVISAKGEGWAASWLDPCGWEPERRVIIPRNGLAANKLRSEVMRVLQARKASVEELAA